MREIGLHIYRTAKETQCRGIRSQTESQTEAIEASKELKIFIVGIY
jgi:hypothetical protein